MPDTVVFTISADEPREIIPIVNGRSLIDLVADFERSHAFDSAGKYAGICPAHFRFGDLTLYYLGRETQEWPTPGRAWLLGCDCGEVGCWPLEAAIDVTDNRVIWQDFRQPHRPGRDYRGFGPFVFARHEYDHAVQQAVVTLGSG